MKELGVGGICAYSRAGFAIQPGRVNLGISDAG